MKDDDSFVAEILAARDVYRFTYGDDGRASVRASRARLRAFTESARIMLNWLADADRAGSAEAEAASKLTSALWSQGEGRELLTETAENLQKIMLASTEATEFLSQDKRPKSAPRHAADQLWSILPRHGVPVTKYANSPAVQLLQAIARDAGDRSITLLAAKKFLSQTDPNRNARKPKARRVRS